MRDTTRDAEVAELYAATAPGLIGVFTVLSGNRADAEDLVQDAFARLLPRWSRIREMDDPRAWVRVVALNLLISRHRRNTVARLGLRRLAREDVQPELSATAVDVHVALASLPLAQRIAVVLHHALDLPVEQVAAECGVPVGTVKSRLARGRAALGAALSEEMVNDV